MKKLSIAGLVVTVAALSGCSTPHYWYQPLSPEQLTKPGLDGTWQGLARQDYNQRYSYSALAGHVSIRCAAYQDLVKLQVQGGEINGSLGTRPVYSFKTPISASGEFSYQIPVKGDTWVYGGVGIYDTSPVLKLRGRLDPQTGIGKGEIAVTPAHQTLGCYGHFEVSRNAGAPKPESLTQPFKVQYWIDRVEGSDSNQGTYWLN